MFDPSDCIHRFTRAQAIEDGVLVDVTETAREAGFSVPVVVTARVWANVVVPDDRARPYGQSEAGRLWDLVWMAYTAIRAASRAGRSGDSLLFEVLVIQKVRQRRVKRLKIVVGPGDEGEPVATIMFPDED